MTFLPHKHITTHHGDTETQRKIEGQISYLNVAERRFLEICIPSACFLNYSPCLCVSVVNLKIHNENCCTKSHSRRLDGKSGKYDLSDYM